MKADEAFINMFGDLTVLHVIEFCFAMYFIIRISIDIIKFINRKHDEEQQKTADLAEALAGTRAMPAYRQQSIQIQGQLNQKITDVQNEMNNKFDEVEKKFSAVMDKLCAFEESQKQREKSRIRDLLIQSYNLYANEVRNPMLKWSEMEYSNFMALYQDYVDLGGNSFIQTHVKPAMDTLIVVKMDDIDELYNVMHSRQK